MRDHVKVVKAFDVSVLSPATLTNLFNFLWEDKTNDTDLENRLNSMRHENTKTLASHTLKKNFVPQSKSNRLANVSIELGVIKEGDESRPAIQDTQQEYHDLVE